MLTKKVPNAFYMTEDTLAAARDLLGKLIVVPDEKGRRVSGMIVEAEAYCGVEDRAAHSYGGRRTPRNEVTYAVGGHVYVFFIYGMYYQLNVVTGPADHPHVVLIRAVEPVDGIEIMRERRGFFSEPGATVAGPTSNTGKSYVPEPTGSKRDKNLTSGPGKLCIAMGIDRGLNAEHLSGERIWLEDHRTFSDDEIAAGKRIGIDYAGEDAEKPWRFWVKRNDFVSKPNGSL